MGYDKMQSDEIAIQNRSRVLYYALKLVGILSLFEMCKLPDLNNEKGWRKQ